MDTKTAYAAKVTHILLRDYKRRERESALANILQKNETSIFSSQLTKTHSQTLANKNVIIERTPGKYLATNAPR